MLRESSVTYASLPQEEGSPQAAFVTTRSVENPHVRRDCQLAAILTACVVVIGITLAIFLPLALSLSREASEREGYISHINELGHQLVGGKEELIGAAGGGGGGGGGEDESHYDPLETPGDPGDEIHEELNPGESEISPVGGGEEEEEGIGGQGIDEQIPGDLDQEESLPSGGGTEDQPLPGDEGERGEQPPMEEGGGGVGGELPQEGQGEEGGEAVPQAGEGEEAGEQQQAGEVGEDLGADNIYKTESPPAEEGEKAPDGEPEGVEPAAGVEGEGEGSDTGSVQETEPPLAPLPTQPPEGQENAGQQEGDAPPEEDHKGSLSQDDLLDEIFGTDTPVKPATIGYGGWMDMSGQDQVTVTILAIVVGVAMAAVIVAAACLVHARIKARRRRIRIHNVITDLQSRDKIVLMNSDESEDEE